MSHTLEAATPPFPPSGSAGSAELLERLPSQAGALAREVGETAATMGARAYLVGGPVRDLMLGSPSLDLDFAVEGDAIPVARALARRLGGRAKVHGRFGTATVALQDGGALDLATTRAERYPRPGALPEVGPAALADDLRRRDFTVNAMAVAINPEEWGRLHDPHGGAADLEARALRVLHSGSFRDDSTRVIRGVRLEQRLRFRMEPHTGRLAVEAARGGGFDALTPERLRDALNLLLGEPRASGGLLRLEELGFWTWFAPGLALDRDLLERMDAVLADESAWAAITLRRPLVWLAALLAPLGPDQAAKQAAQRVRLSPQAAADLGRVVGSLALMPGWTARPPPPSALVATLRALPEEAPVLLAAAAGEGPLRERIAWYAREGRQARLAIDGSDLLALGYPPGPAIGAALRAVLTARLDGRVSGREAELRWAQRWLEDQAEGRQA